MDLECHHSSACAGTAVFVIIDPSDIGVQLSSPCTAGEDSLVPLGNCKAHLRQPEGTWVGHKWTLLATTNQSILIFVHAVPTSAAGHGDDSRRLPRTTAGLVDNFHSLSNIIIRAWSLVHGHHNQELTPLKKHQIFQGRLTIAIITKRSKSDRDPDCRLSFEKGLMSMATGSTPG